MTRSRERLFLTSCRRRRIAGRYQDQMESPFLAELPAQLLDVSASPDLFLYERPDPRTQTVYSFFNQGRPASSPAPAAPPARPLPSVPSAPSGFNRPAPPSTGRQVVPDLEHTAPRRAIRRGSRVRHPTLGPGVVLDLDGEGDEARLTVFFEKSGKRKLVAKFANLEML